jgi:Fe-S-cluster containining protein
MTIVTAKQNCRQCGKCCEKWGWDQKGIIEDIIPWIIHNRRDILQHVSLQFTDGIRASGAAVSAGDLHRIKSIYYWTDPNGRILLHCPFFRRAEDGNVYCRIHDTKPAVCESFAPWAEIWHDYGLNCPACRNTSP